MTFRIRSTADAGPALAYFNAFHDGFIQELTLRSGDRFAARGVHEISGHLTVDILFAHYNYRQGEPPADQRVHARFEGVREFRADFPLGAGEWSIDRLSIEPCGLAEEAERSHLSARLHQHRLIDGAWTAREGLVFSFREALLEEM